MMQSHTFLCKTNPSVLWYAKHQANTSKERMATIYSSSFFELKAIYIISKSCLFLLQATLKPLPQNYGVKAIHKITSWNCYISHLLYVTNDIVTVKMEINLGCFLANNIFFNSSSPQNNMKIIPVRKALWCYISEWQEGKKKTLFFYQA